jgi:hypothetical protein
MAVQIGRDTMFNHDILEYLTSYLTPPGGYESFVDAKLKYSAGAVLSEEDVKVVVTTASFFAGVLRTAYKRFVKDEGIDPKEYWNTVVIVFKNSGIWSNNWRKVFKSPKGAALVKDTILPAWTPIGLCGANWRTLYQMLEIWCSRQYIQTEAV